MRTVYPELIQKHRGAGSLLLTPRLDTQATFAKLFADIGVDGDIRYAQVDELLKYGRPAPASITTRHVQALRTDLRAETLSHAAGLTSHTTVLSLANRDSSGRTKLAMDAARWASLVPEALPSSWDRWIRTAWWALCKRFTPTASLSTALTGIFPRPHFRSLLAHKTFLRSCNPSKPPAGPTCRLHSRFRTRKGELFY